MKKKIFIMGFSILLLITVFLSGCVSKQYDYGGSPSNTQGRVLFTLADKAVNTSSVSSVEVTVDKVEAHTQEDSWITVLNAQKTYDLLKLKTSGNQVLLADVQLDPGTYNQVRLTISKVMITDSNGTHEAKLPSGVLKINTDLTVQANTTSTFMFDFLLDESLHTTGNGLYIMAPVIQAESREDAQVDATDENDVEVKGGRVKSSVKVGMDVNGNVDVGLKIAKDAKLTIGTDDKVKLGLGL